MESSSSSHYSTLLNTVSDLRTDLEKAMTKIRLLEDQNGALMDNNQNLKDQLFETRSKYNEAKENYLQTVAEKFAAEQQHEAFMEKLKFQLDEKTKEFDLIREKLVPHDIDQLRIKVQEEVEIQHKQQIRVMQDELEMQRDQFFAVKREFDHRKLEYELEIQSLQEDIFVLKAERDNMENDLREEIDRLKSVDVAPAKDETIRSLKSKMNELNYLVECTRVEAKNCRAERDALVLELSQAKTIHEDVSSQLRSRMIVAEAEKNAMEERAGKISLESDKKDAQLRSTKHCLDDVNEKLDALQKQHQDLLKSVAAQKEEQQKHADWLSSSHFLERTELQEQIELLNDRLLEREDLLRKAQREATDLQLRAESVETELRRNHQLQLQELRKKISAAELDLAESRNMLKAAEAQVLFATEQFNFERDGLQSDLSRIKQEKANLLTRLHEKDLLLDGDKRKLTKVREEAEQRLLVVEAKLKECQFARTSLENRLRSAESDNAELQRSVQSLRELSERLERRNAEYAAAVEGVKSEFQLRFDQIAPTFKEKYQALKKKLTAEVAKEKKRADAYKGKLLEVHARNKLSGEDV